MNRYNHGLIALYIASVDLREDFIGLENVIDCNLVLSILRDMAGIVFRLSSVSSRDTYQSRFKTKDDPVHWRTCNRR